MKKPVLPVPAATILMLRDTSPGLEVFMVVRHHQIDFASGALVFPGGKVDPGDSEVHRYCDGTDDFDAQETALRAGAIREAFEECGILLARDSKSGSLVTAERLARVEHYRDPLNQAEISLVDFLSSESLTLACDLLQPYAHWITPEMMPKRFDTHFYLARAPEDHLALHDGHESVDSVWISPSDALAGADTGQYTVIFPTRLNLQMLAESHSVEEALEMAAARSIVPVLPWVEQREDGAWLRIQEEAGYRVNEIRMEGNTA